MLSLPGISPQLLQHLLIQRLYARPEHTAACVLGIDIKGMKRDQMIMEGFVKIQDLCNGNSPKTFEAVPSQQCPSSSTQAKISSLKVPSYNEM